MQFPGIYQKVEQIVKTRFQYADYLTALEQRTDKEIYKELRRVGVGGLAYQGRNDLQLQKHRGMLLQRAIATLPTPTIGTAHPKRIGIVSSQLNGSTPAPWLLGWMKLLPEVEWRTYQLGRIVQDPFTQLFKTLSTFAEFPQHLRPAIDQIAADCNTALIYPDLGLHPCTSLLASLRLAPIQCATWGHPVTSGIPTIDYFLSAEAFEPENADEHYSEELIRLPGIGAGLPLIPVVEPEKEHFELTGYTVFLMLQRPAKYLPQYDWIYREIAQQSQNPLFVYMDHPWGDVRQLAGRIGVPWRIYPRLKADEFLKLLASGDVVLDPPGWSGLSVNHQAIAQGTPIVTAPGEFMRGRLAWGLTWAVADHGMDHSAFGYPANLAAYPATVATVLNSGAKRVPAQVPFDSGAIARTLREVLLS